MGKSSNGDLSTAFSVKTNDQLMAIYLSSLIRAITAFHDLIDNKIQNRQAQEDKDAKKEEILNGEKKDANGANGESKEGDKDKDKDKESKEKKK